MSSKSRIDDGLLPPEKREPTWQRQFLVFTEDVPKGMFLSFEEFEALLTQYPNIRIEPRFYSSGLALWLYNPDREKVARSYGNILPFRISSAHDIVHFNGLLLVREPERKWLCN